MLGAPGEERALPGRSGRQRAAGSQTARAHTYYVNTCKPFRRAKLARRDLCGSGFLHRSAILPCSTHTSYEFTTSTARAVLPKPLTFTTRTRRPSDSP